MKTIRPPVFASVLLLGAPSTAMAVTAAPAFDPAATPWLVLAASLMIVALLAALALFLRRQVQKSTGELAGTEEKLKSTEDHARAVLAALPDLLFTLDPSGMVLEVRAPPPNEYYHNPFRYLGRRITETLPANVAEETLHKMAQLSDPGQVVLIETEIELRGRVRSFDGRITKMADGNFLAIVRDVSDRHRAWLADLEQNKQESLSVLAGGLAHDFNNSLAVIQGFVSLARLQLSQPDKASTSLDKAVLATRRAASLTARLRVLTQGLEGRVRRISVREVAEEAAEFAVVGTSCELTVEAGPGPWTVNADPDQLAQVFHNLVLNAVQSMPKGGPITLLLRKPTLESIEVNVSDKGEGIPQERMSQIFDPYFTTKSQGSGLGLSVVQAVVARHGGSVSVSSRVGRGTVFTVILPSAEGEPEAKPIAEPVDASRLRGQRVLIMEDEVDLRELLSQVFSDLGMEAEACRNGELAVEAFDRAVALGRPFGLLVSDLVVPGQMGGRELIATLRKRQTPFRALAVTANAIERRAEDFDHRGFDVIVAKPFSLEELKTHVTRLMGS